MNSILNKPVFTPHGKGIVVHEFLDQTVCVEFEFGGGMILPVSEVFVRPDVRTSRLVRANKSPLPGEGRFVSMVA